MLVHLARLAALVVAFTLVTHVSAAFAQCSANLCTDKLEQLYSLVWTDSTSDTRRFPALVNGGSGLDVGGSHDRDRGASAVED